MSCLFFFPTTVSVVYTFFPFELRWNCFRISSFIVSFLLSPLFHYFLFFRLSSSYRYDGFDGVEVDLGAVLRAALLEESVPPVPYTLSDMANDVVGLLDHLRIKQAHIFGVSLGGMIAQVLTIEHPTRVRSLISVMSMSGEPEYGQSMPEAINALLSETPSDRAGFIEHSVIYQIYQSKKYRSDEFSKISAARDFDRMYYPQGSTRQLAAVYASGRRTEKLRAIKTPTLVIHGKDDTLISPSGGERTAELIPGAKYVLVENMGHDMPKPLWGYLVELITDFVAAN